MSAVNRIPMELGQNFCIIRFRFFNWVRICIWVWKNLHRKKISSSEFSLMIVFSIQSVWATFSCNRSSTTPSKLYIGWYIVLYCSFEGGTLSGKRLPLDRISYHRKKLPVSKSDLSNDMIITSYRFIFPFRWCVN